MDPNNTPPPQHLTALGVRPGIRGSAKKSRHSHSLRTRFLGGGGAGPPKDLRKAYHRAQQRVRSIAPVLEEYSPPHLIQRIRNAATAPLTGGDRQLWAANDSGPSFGRAASAGVGAGPAAHVFPPTAASQHSLFARDWGKLENELHQMAVPMTQGPFEYPALEPDLLPEPELAGVSFGMIRPMELREWGLRPEVSGEFPAWVLPGQSLAHQRLVGSVPGGRAWEGGGMEEVPVHDEGAPSFAKAGDQQEHQRNVGGGAAGAGGGPALHQRFASSSETQPPYGLYSSQQMRAYTYMLERDQLNEQQGFLPRTLAVREAALADLFNRVKVNYFNQGRKIKYVVSMNKLTPWEWNSWTECTSREGGARNNCR